MWYQCRRRGVRIAVLAAGGALAVLEGCDPNVRDTVLSGVGTAATSLASTFIQAFVQSLQSEDGDANQPTTVKAIHRGIEQPIFV